MSIEKVVNGRKLYRFKQQLFGAKSGLIYIFDERDGTQAVATCDDFLARAEALGLEAARCVYGSERSELVNGANDMEACAAEAAAQGDPTDEHVLEYYRRHRSKCGNTILVGPGAAQLGVPSSGGAPLPPPPKKLLKGGVLLKKI